MQIPVHFDPRWYQAKALRALEAGVKLSIWCWGRRAGKDMTSFSYTIKKMVEQPMNAVKVFPTKEQGKEAFWDNVENDGFKTIEHIPQSLIAREDNKNMKISLINGSTFSLLGTKDPDALRGANAKLYDFSEFVDIDSYALDVIRPVVAVNGGQIIVQSTPKIDGISGGMFKILFDMAKKNPKQFASLITAREYLTPEILEELRQEYIAKYGNDFQFRQEFLCDWGQAGTASYYGAILKAMEKDGRIGIHPYNPAHPVYTARDIGTSDSTAIVFFQYYLVAGKAQVRIIDYYETHDIGRKAIIAAVAQKPYIIAWHFFPHDGSVRESDLISRLEKYREDGLTNCSLLRRESVDSGINQVVESFKDTVINQGTTTSLIRKLYLYKRMFNPLTGDYMGPEHKSESHAADSVRYVFTAIEQEFNKTTCEMYLTNTSQGDSYDSKMPDTNIYSPAMN